MSEFETRFVAPILACARPDPVAFIEILCRLAENDRALQKALAAAVEGMAQRHLAEAAGLRAVLHLRRLTGRKAGPT